MKCLEGHCLWIPFKKLHNGPQKQTVHQGAVTSVHNVKFPALSWSFQQLLCLPYSHHHLDYKPLLNRKYEQKLKARKILEKWPKKQLVHPGAITCAHIVRFL